MILRMQNSFVIRRKIKCWLYQYSDAEKEMMMNSDKWKALRKKAIEYYRGCCFCGRDKEPFNLHHRFYFRNRAIDDYKLHEVAIFCKNCHDKLHKKYLEDLKELRKKA